MGRGDAKYVGREVGEHLASKTPPGSFYTDEMIFRRELEEFYYRSWMNLCREDQIARPGDFFTRAIGGAGADVGLWPRRGLGGPLKPSRQHGGPCLLRPSGTIGRAHVSTPVG